MGGIENRKSYRFPFRAKLVFSFRDRVVAGNTVNISTDGIFVTTFEKLDAFEKCQCVFPLVDGQEPLILHGVIRRVIATTINPEDVPGVAIQFDAGQPSRDRLLEFSSESRRSYELVSTLLSSGEPDVSTLAPVLAKMHMPAHSDLGELRRYVERVLQSIELVDRTNARIRGSEQS